MSMRSLEINAIAPENGNDNQILCCGAVASSKSQNDVTYNLDNRRSSEEACFYLIYEAHRSAGFPNCTVSLYHAEFHCYPYVIGQLMGFCEEMSSSLKSYSTKNTPESLFNSKYTESKPGFGFQRFGFSNFIESGLPEYGISLECFPFVTVYNTGSLGSFENVLVHPVNDWKKYITPREREVRDPESAMKKASEKFSGQLSNSRSDVAAFSVAGAHEEPHTIAVNVDLYGVKVHFHDSSSVVGTLTLPTTRSSLLICEESLDMLCSAKDVTFTSSLWTQNFTSSLWGPMHQTLSSVLNMRVRKGFMGSNLEISFGVQNVCCVLPPEYMSILLGYFSLPEWNFDPSNKPVAGSHDDARENLSSMVYKFEILDSSLVFPVESDKSQYLKLEIPHMFSCFVQESTSEKLFSGICPECLMSPHVVANRNHCLDVFGQDLHLSLLSFKEGYDCLYFDKEIGCGNITLIKPLSADIWVRIPCDIEPSKGHPCASTLIMARVKDCQVFADGK